MSPRGLCQGQLLLRFKELVPLCLGRQTYSKTDRLSEDEEEDGGLGVGTGEDCGESLGVSAAEAGPGTGEEVSKTGHCAVGEAEKALPKTDVLGRGEGSISPEAMDDFCGP